jgi:hypothetical protein
MRYLYFLMIFVLISCSSNNNSKQLSNNEFEELYDRLPQIDLPLSIQTSGDKMFNKDLHDVTDKQLINRFGSRGGLDSPLGKIYKDSNVFVVLSFIPDDVGTPKLSVYNKLGLKVDSLMIFDDKPAATVGSRTKEFATIQKNYQIQFLDSTEYLDTMGLVINKEVIRKTYYVDKSGKIKHK